MCVYGHTYIYTYVHIYTYASVHAKLLQTCPTLCSSMDCSLQAPLSMGFSRQEYCNGFPFPPPGGILNPGIRIKSTWMGRWVLYHWRHLESSYIFLEIFLYVTICVWDHTDVLNSNPLHFMDHYNSSSFLFVAFYSNSEKPDSHHLPSIYLSCSIAVHMCNNIRIINLSSSYKNFIT